MHHSNISTCGLIGLKEMKTLPTLLWTYDTFTCFIYSHVLLNWLFMCLPSDTVYEGIMFLGCPVRPFVHLFIRSDIVTTISHEWLEQF